MTLRPATIDDAEALARLGHDSFVAAFAHLYSTEDLGAFLAAHKTPQAYARYLANPQVRTMLALEGDDLAGFCILVRPSEFAPHSDALNPVALSQLYCAPGMSGRGVGAALMEWALADSAAEGSDAVQLSVWSGNHGAQRFYARYGFGKIADIHFMVGNQRDDEFLFELRLPDGLATT